MVYGDKVTVDRLEPNEKRRKIMNIKFILILGLKSVVRSSSVG